MDHFKQCSGRRPGLLVVRRDSRARNVEFESRIRDGSFFTFIYCKIVWLFEKNEKEVGAHSSRLRNWFLFGFSFSLEGIKAEVFRI